MLDRVEERMEIYRSETNSYRRERIFSNKEIQRILETRGMHEKKINGERRRPEDFLRYINSEMVLERIIEKRLKNSATDITSNIIERNIIRIGRIGLSKFESDEILVLIVRYLQEKGMNKILINILQEYCMKHPCDADIWIYFVQCLWEMSDIENARKTILRAIGLNEKNIHLYIEFFRLEMFYAKELYEINLEFGISPKEEEELFSTAETIYNEILLRDEKSAQECLAISEYFPELKSHIKRRI